MGASEYNYAPMKPGDTLGHYTIVSHLGSGGMGAVYRATDRSLGRDVALKVLPSDVATDPERLERFRREARAVAALNHPHIVTIYSVEHADGVHFLTMELVTGRPLDRVIAERSLPMARVVEVAHAVSEALAAAHERGIVHRDLKPANVVLSDDGRVKVLDFGLAKMRSDAPASHADAATNLATQIGAVIGTPAYMSPEQVSGLDVDHRTDIFSLGVLLYELATGVRPFRGRSSAELASSILRDVPAPASEVGPGVPEELARVIARCLEKSASARFSSMADVKHALRPDPATNKKEDYGASVAVLPFQNLSADPGNDYFGDGLAEEILNALAQIDGLRVAARTSSFSFKGRAVDLSEIGTKLKVSTVLEGSVRRAGNRLRVTVQLVDVAKGFQLWSERYDRELADIFDVQEEIARAIAEKLKVTLTTSDSARLVKTATVSVEAYELYLRGRALLLKRGRHVSEGIRCLRRAVELDPNFAGAWAGLADSYTVRGYWAQSTPGEVMPKALTAARRAVALDPDFAEGHSALAMALLLWERDYKGAEREFRRALELNPNYTQGRGWWGVFWLLWARGRVDEGIAEVRRALENDPLSAYATTLLAMALGHGDQTAEGLDKARLGVERDPDSLLTHWTHGMAAGWHGQFDEAMTAFQKAEAVSGSHVYTIAHAAVACGNAGRLSDARARFDRLRHPDPNILVPRFTLAMAAAAAGEQDQAIELALEACDEREPVSVIMARTFPDARRLRADSRFGEVLRRLALPD